MVKGRSVTNSSVLGVTANVMFIFLQYCNGNFTPVKSIFAYNGPAMKM